MARMDSLDRLWNDSVRGCRTREQKALEPPAALIVQPLELSLGFDTFSQNFKMELAGEFDDTAADFRRSLVRGEAGDERAVDLQPVNGEASQVRQ